MVRQVPASQPIPCLMTCECTVMNQTLGTPAKLGRLIRIGSLIISVSGAPKQAGDRLPSVDQGCGLELDPSNDRDERFQVQV